jgi:hypothetical protein
MQVSTKRGLIRYPRDVHWGDVYALEFVPFMRLIGHNWRIPGKDDGERLKKGMVLKEDGDVAECEDGEEEEGEVRFSPLVFCTARKLCPASPHPAQCTLHSR